MNDSQPELKTGRSAPVHPSPGWTAQLQLLIFDLDGVITSEARYWQTARLTVWDLITQPDFLGLRDYWGADLRDPEAVLAAGDQVIAPTFIAELKRRGINSNWDLTFFVLSLQVIAILAQLDPPRLHRALAAIPDPDAGAAQQLQTLGSWLPDPYPQNPPPFSQASASNPGDRHRAAPAGSYPTPAGLGVIRLF